MKIKKRFISPLLLLAPYTANAETINQANTAWILTSTALVLFMTLPGLALFYGGLVRSKNVLSVLMQCFVITCVVSLLWLIGAYSLAFDNSGNWPGLIGGTSKFFLSGITETSSVGDLPESVFFMFQMTFAIISPALIIGGFAERMKFSSMIWFSIIWLLFAYAPVCHWVWSDSGWLNARGFLDFAGGAVVHINAGVAALVAALVLGRRHGFPETAMPPHNMTMTVAGAGMLWVGWFGFNGGSALAADSSAGMAILVTHIGASCGALAWMVIEWVRFGKPSALGVVTGMVAGLGTITPASGFVGPLGAIVIGFTAGTVCFFATQLIKRGLKIDDSLDVFPVHGVGGVIGTLMTGLFVASSLGGVGLADGRSITDQLLVQLTGIVATALWSAAVTYAALKLLDATLGLRVTIEEEIEGLDIVLHEETGYNL